jgi:phosphomannomutase/phosphoglucomutase
LVKHLTSEIQIMKLNKKKIDDLIIDKILTVNGIRFTLSDGSWGLIRASSNKPSLVIVTESPTSEKRKKAIFEFIDEMLQSTGAVGDYDQKI